LALLDIGFFEERGSDELRLPVLKNGVIMSSKVLATVLSSGVSHLENVFSVAIFISTSEMGTDRRWMINGRIMSQNE
jgi:hypothetical protein